MKVDPLRPRVSSWAKPVRMPPPPLARAGGETSGEMVAVCCLSVIAASIVGVAILLLRTDVTIDHGLALSALAITSSVAGWYAPRRVAMAMIILIATVSLVVNLVAWCAP